MNTLTNSNKAFIVYFTDKTAVVVLASDAFNALGRLTPEQIDNIYRVEPVPYPVL